MTQPNHDGIVIDEGEAGDIFPPVLVAKAIRDNGYKTTAHALAELIDNSVQAGASVVRLFCVEKLVPVRTQQRYKVTQIAVLDNGCGMNDVVLRMALQFGNGTHLDDRSGIGRFGVGLPSSSLSQCKTVTVYSWDGAGPDNALMSYLSIDEIMANTMRKVPGAVHQPVPQEWRKYAAAQGEALGPTGTLVVWSDLDRVKWSGAQATMQNTEFLVGRMYRNMIQRGSVTIDLVAVREGEVCWSNHTHPNDPGYLMQGTNTPGFEDEAMFRPFGDSNGQRTFDVDIEDGSEHKVRVTCSWYTEKAGLPDSGGEPGSRPYGSHAKRNSGVSIVRADRELDLDPRWVTDSFHGRWWGIEIEFPAELDEVFGVTNNKQSAMLFSELADFFADQSRSDEWAERKIEWEDAGDPRQHLLRICQYIANQKKAMEVAIKSLRVGTRSRARHEDPDSAEVKGSRTITELAKDAPVAVVDDVVPDEELKATVELELIESGVGKDAAREFAESFVSRKLKVLFTEKTDPEVEAFFVPKALGGVHEIELLRNHPFYERLYAVLHVDEDADPDTLKAQMREASETLKLLLVAFAREEFDARDREAGWMREIRRLWGRSARVFLTDGEPEDL